MELFGLPIISITWKNAWVRSMPSGQTGGNPELSPLSPSGVILLRGSLSRVATENHHRLPSDGEAEQARLTRLAVGTAPIPHELATSDPTRRNEKMSF